MSGVKSSLTSHTRKFFLLKVTPSFYLVLPRNPSLSDSPFLAASRKSKVDSKYQRNNPIVEFSLEHMYTHLETLLLRNHYGSSNLCFAETGMSHLSLRPVADLTLEGTQISKCLLTLLRGAHGHSPQNRPCLADELGLCSLPSGAVFTPLHSPRLSLG